jgi:hypothetical protein
MLAQLNRVPLGKFNRAPLKSGFPLRSNKHPGTSIFLGFVPCVTQKLDLNFTILAYRDGWIVSQNDAGPSWAKSDRPPIFSYK